MSEEPTGGEHNFDPFNPAKNNPDYRPSWQSANPVVGQGGVGEGQGGGDSPLPEAANLPETDNGRTFEQILKESRNPALSAEGRRRLNDEMRDMVEGFGVWADEFLSTDLPTSIDAAFRGRDWDDIAQNFKVQARESQNDVSGIHGYRREWNGIVGVLVRGVGADARLRGYQARVDQEGPYWPDIGDFEDRKRLGLVDRQKLEQQRREARVVQEILNNVEGLENLDLFPTDLTGLVGYRGENPEVQRLQQQVENQRREHQQLYQRILDFFNQQQAVQPRQLQQGGVPTPEDWARMMGHGTPEEQRELYLRAEEVMYPMQMQLQVPSFLLDPNPLIRSREQREWRARAALASMAANKRMAPSYDKQFPNQDMIDFTGEYLMDTMNMDGAIDMASFYTYCIAENADISFLHVQDVSNGNFIRSIFQIKTIQQFVAFRESVRNIATANWGLSAQEARDAEHVAWNLIYSSNVVEEYDSIYKNGLPDRIPSSVPQLKALTVWMMMHPQERLTLKAGDPKQPAKQEAMGMFGEWAVNRTKRTRRKLDMEILPRTMFENALKGVKVGVGGEETTLFEVFRRNGRVLFTGNGNYVDADSISWGSMEMPFSGYQFDTVTPAIKVFDVIMKGKDSGVDLMVLGNACRKLKLNNKQREILLMAWEGVKAKGGRPTPKVGMIDWAYVKAAVKKNYPGFFK